jgi:hypothetical protein
MALMILISLLAGIGLGQRFTVFPALALALCSAICRKRKFR